MTGNGNKSKHKYIFGSVTEKIAPDCSTCCEFLYRHSNPSLVLLGSKTQLSHLSKLHMTLPKLWISDLFQTYSFQLTRCCHYGVLEGLVTRVILVLRSSPVESNLRVESQPSALHDVELRLRVLNIQLDMLTAGRPPLGADTGGDGDQSQQQRGEHD